MTKVEEKISYYRLLMTQVNRKVVKTITVCDKDILKFIISLSTTS